MIRGDGSGKDQPEAPLGAFHQVLDGLVLEAAFGLVVLAAADGGHAETVLDANRAYFQRTRKTDKFGHDRSYSS